jgi:hypothetical protein
VEGLAREVGQERQREARRERHQPDGGLAALAPVRPEDRRDHDRDRE